ncbi:GDCCVxC domain-containing (seleno)protein [Catalinimonas alkaloidigena]|uniref:GDCCVxC domain-containing (seleno)protein n=1 Tax=Catalinimonas alkaloidigena TaxID=1075417 RepID=UPI002406CA62|nr:GDCCVxC domain-containing (seleno)protein [Catalinimonas alkaloidigena]
MGIELSSVIKCPNCHVSSKEEMPQNACQYFYECKHCKTVLKPQNSDCCVYCSYGSVPCPPVQQSRGCCS